MRLCTITDCARKHLAKGMCRAHYLRLYKRGSLELQVMRGSSVTDRIMAKVTVQADGCWLYNGCLTTNGYGHIRDGRAMKLAHVVTYEAKHGAVPEDMELDHTCRKRACCNPDHTEPVTHAQNVQRGLAGHDWATRTRNASGQFTKEKGFI